VPRKDLKDITGQWSGDRRAVSYASNKQWLVECKCGYQTIIDGADFRRRKYRCKHVLEDRFWDKVDKTQNCWLWLGHLNEDGYGKFKNGQKCVLAHRFALVLAGIVLKPDLEVDHLCRNRACVNPDHLEQVTHHENVKRGDLKYVSKKRFGKAYVED
jgi:hypothetical protein